MQDYESASKKSTWAKRLLLIAVASVVMTGCKNSGIQPPPSGGMPPPSGGMPTPPGGGGQQGGGKQSGGQQGGGEQGGGQQGGGQQGGGQPGGGESPSSGSEGSDGSGGIGEIPPSEQGGAGGGESSGGDGGGGEDNPFSDSEAAGEGECGDTGAMPGGIGGMGQEGECISESASASESDSQSESSSSSSGSEGGGASGGGASGGGASGGGASGGGAAGTGGAGSVGEFPAESAAERAERLGRELEESIGGFDETLGEEQREIASAGRVMEGFDIEGGNGESSGELIDLGSQSAGASNSTGGMVGSSSNAPSSPLAGMSDEEIQERTPEDVPRMADDDIIARQLREAALVEEDPDLRDRLWDEYRKYKGL